MSAAYDFLKECRHFWVTSTNYGCPACRPFGAAAEYMGAIYISTGKAKDVYKQLKKNAFVQITALKEGTREWLRLDATAEERTSFSEKQMMLDACPDLKKHFSSPDCPSFALFRLNDCRALLYTDDGIRNID